MVVVKYYTYHYLGARSQWSFSYTCLYKGYILYTETDVFTCAMPYNLLSKRYPFVRGKLVVFDRTG